MNRVLREFWKYRMELYDARYKYLTSIERLKACDNRYMRRLNQSVCKAMKQRYKESTKQYQNFLRNISDFSYT